MHAVIKNNILHSVENKLCYKNLLAWFHCMLMIQCLGTTLCKFANKILLFRLNSNGKAVWAAGKFPLILSSSHNHPLTVTQVLVHPEVI